MSGTEEIDVLIHRLEAANLRLKMVPGGAGAAPLIDEGETPIIFIYLFLTCLAICPSVCLSLPHSNTSLSEFVE